MLAVVAGGELEADDADERGQTGPGKDADARIGLGDRVGDREVDDEERDREADAGEHGTRRDVSGSQGLGELADVQTASEHRRPEDADELADDEAGDDTPRQGRTEGVGQGLARDEDTGVDEREDGDDDEADDAAQGELEAVVDRHRAKDALSRGHAAFGVRAAAEARREILRLVDELMLRREHRQEQAEDDTGDRRVDSGLEDGEPEEDAEDGVDEAAPRLHLLDEPGDGGQGRGDPEPEEVDVLGVEEGDDGECPDVIDDGEGEDEDAQLRGDAGAERGEDADDERGVGGDDDTPGPHLGGAPGDGDEDERGNDESGDGTDDRQCRALPRAQFAEDDVLLHLEGDEEEEQHHHCVVDPVLKGHLEFGGAGDEPELRVDDGVVAVRGQVGPQEGDGGGGEQNDGAGALRAEERGEPRGQAIGHVSSSPVGPSRRRGWRAPASAS